MEVEERVKRRLAVPCCSVAPAPAAFGAALPLLLMVVPSLSAEEAPYVAGVAIRRRARRPVVGSLAVPCCSVAVAPAPPREKGERTKEHRLSSSAPRSVRSLGDVRGEEGGGKAGSGREERHEERAGEKEEARQGAARSRWGAPSCRAGFGVSASFIVGFVRVVIVGQEWLRQVQQSSRTRGTDSIGDAICLMVLQLLSCSVRTLESGDEREMRSTLEVVMKKGFILNSSTRRLLVVELFNLQNPNCKGIKFC